MPQFILEHGSDEAARSFRALDSFTQGYIEAMFFTDTGDRDDGDLENACTADLSAEALEEIKAECAAFQAKAAKLLARAYERSGYDEEMAGRDFWYTRNGHGVGFWDRDALDRGGLGNALTELCGWSTGFPERSIYRGDDGAIYYTEG